MFNENNFPRLRYFLVLLPLIISSCENDDGPPIITEAPDVVRPGFQVTIWGKNFGDPTFPPVFEVKFNGVLSTYVDISSSEELHVKVPEGITPGKITITWGSFITESPNGYLVSPWKFIGGINQSLSGNIFFSHSNDLFVSAQNKLLRYNISSGNYGTATEFPEATSPNSGENVRIAHFVIDGKLFVHFEYSDEKGFYEYTIDENKWTRKTDFPLSGSVTRKFGFSLNGKGYFVFGDDGFEPDDNRRVWEYDIALDNWTQKTGFTGLWRSAFVFYKTSENAFLGAGLTREGDALRDRWKYYPDADNWVRVEDFPGEPRYSAVAFNLANRIYYGYGHNWQRSPDYFFKDFHFYDQDQVWTEIPSAKHDFLVSEGYTSAGNKGYILTYNTIFELDPSK